MDVRGGPYLVEKDSDALIALRRDYDIVRLRPLVHRPTVLAKVVLGRSNNVERFQNLQSDSHREGMLFVQRMCQETYRR